jgi:hypothetical protein
LQQRCNSKWIYLLLSKTVHKSILNTARSVNFHVIDYCTIHKKNTPDNCCKNISILCVGVFAHWGWEAWDISSIQWKSLHARVGKLEKFPAPTEKDCSCRTLRHFQHPLKKIAHWDGEPWDISSFKKVCTLGLGSLRHFQLHWRSLHTGVGKVWDVSRTFTTPSSTMSVRKNSSHTHTHTHSFSKRFNFRCAWNCHSASKIHQSLPWMICFPWQPTSTACEKFWFS